MTIPRIYSTESLEDKKTCLLAKDNLRYLKTVLRLKPLDKIIIFDGFGHEYEAVITNFSAAGTEVKLGQKIYHESKKIHLTLAQALPKATKMDFIVKSAAELGVDFIIPFAAQRSVSRITNEKATQKVKRWQKIASEASRSCRSSNLAQVDAVRSFDDMLERAHKESAKMIFWEEETKKTIKNILKDKKLDAFKNYFIIVGPEGGFSKDEIAAATKAGFQSVSLGKQILKVETAVAAIISILQYEKGIFSPTS